MSRDRHEGRLAPRTGRVRRQRGAFRRANEHHEAGVHPRASALCTQVRRALEGALADCGDGLLRDLRVIEVLPDPSIRRVRVWLRGAVADRQARERVIGRLEAARGHLRAQVAAVIHRKRTPDLVFELLAEAERRGERE